MIPHDPAENNLRLAQEFVAKVDRAMHFKYQDLANSPADCLASANTLTHGWISADVPCGAIVLLSMDEMKFNKIKDGLDKFFDWFKDLVKSLVDEFSKLHPKFDFVEAAANHSNQFTEWLRSSLDQQSQAALNKVVEVFAVFKYYAGDMFDVRDNPLRPMLDSVLNHQIGENLSLRTVLEAVGVSFQD